MRQREEEILADQVKFNKGLVQLYQIHKALDTEIKILESLYDTAYTKRGDDEHAELVYTRLEPMLSKLKKIAANNDKSMEAIKNHLDVFARESQQTWEPQQIRSGDGKSN